MLRMRRGGIGFFNNSMIGKLLGHRQVQTTARYAHLARHSVKAPTGRIEDSLATDMNTPLPDSAAT